jgi:hypothetical protein
MCNTTLAVEIFADECFIETVVAEAHKSRGIAFCAFGEVDFLVVLVLAHLI